MVKLSDQSPASAQHLLNKDCPEFETVPFVAGPTLSERRLPFMDAYRTILLAPNPELRRFLEGIQEMRFAA